MVMANNYIGNALQGIAQLNQEQFQNNLATRNQSMREQEFSSQQNALQRQQTQQQQQMDANQALSGARIVQMAAQKGESPKAVAEQLSPTFVKSWDEQHGQGSWASLTDAQVLQAAKGLEYHAMQLLGQSPPQPTLQKLGPGDTLVQTQGTTVNPTAAFSNPKQETFGQPQDMVFNGKPSMVQVGSDGTVRPVGGAEPYNKPPASGFGALTDTAQADNIAQMIAAGVMPMPVGRALLTPMGSYIAQKVKQLNPDFSGATYPTTAAALKAFSSGAESKKVRSLNTAIAHMDSLDELAKALQNNDTQAFNRVANYLSKETGGKAVTNFNAAKQLVADEVTSAVVQGGGGQAEREEAARNFASANSPEQLLGVTQVYRDLLGGQLGSLSKQYEQGTGRKDFNRYLTPRTIKALGGAPGESGSTTPQTTPAQAPVTATGPNGQKIMLQNGQWVPYRGQ